MFYDSNEWPRIYKTDSKTIQWSEYYLAKWKWKYCFNSKTVNVTEFMKNISLLSNFYLPIIQNTIIALYYKLSGIIRNDGLWNLFLV